MTVLVNPSLSPEELRSASHSMGRGKYPRRSKYRNIKQVFEGLRFDSKKELECWMFLKARERAGEITNLRRQVRFDLYASSSGGCDVTKICVYVADFSFFDVRRGKEIVADAKGVKTALFNLKSKMMKACHGIEVELM